MAWEIERLYARASARQATAALAEPVARFELRKQDFLAVIDGMEMDAADRIRIADMTQLEEALLRSGGVRGRPAVGARVQRPHPGRPPGGARQRAAAHQRLPT